MVGGRVKRGIFTCLTTFKGNDQWCYGFLYVIVESAGGTCGNLCTADLDLLVHG